MHCTGGHCKCPSQQRKKKQSQQIPAHTHIAPAYLAAVRVSRIRTGTSPQVRANTADTTKCRQHACVVTMARTAEHLSASSTPDSRFPPEEAFAALATRTDQMQVMIDSLPVLISYIDPQQHYQFANATYSQWFTPQGGSVVGLHMRDVLGHSVYETVRPYVEAALAGEPTRYEADVDFKAAGVMVVDTQIVPHFGRDGTVVGAYELVSDITDRKKAETACSLHNLRSTKGRLAPCG